MILKFKSSDVKTLVDHAKKHPTCNPTVESIANPRFWKKGAKPNGSGFIHPSDIDTANPTTLQLVIGYGVYLYSPSTTPLLDDNAILDDPDDTPHLRVYAEGCRPSGDIEHLANTLDLLGTDDFQTSLPIEMFEASLFQEDFIKLSFSQWSIRLLAKNELHAAF